MSFSMLFLNTSELKPQPFFTDRRKHFFLVQRACFFLGSVEVCFFNQEKSTTFGRIFSHICCRIFWKVSGIVFLLFLLIFYLRLGALVPTI